MRENHGIYTKKQLVRKKGTFFYLDCRNVKPLLSHEVNYTQRNAFFRNKIKDFQRSRLRDAISPPQAFCCFHDTDNRSLGHGNY